MSGEEGPPRDQGMRVLPAHGPMEQRPRHVPGGALHLCPARPDTGRFRLGQCALHLRPARPDTGRFRLGQCALHLRPTLMQVKKY